MEVHQHSHTPRKKWNHYLWEFIMLFLAVFAGFLAENQREHYVENRRERIYIRSLVQDLANDTTIFLNFIDNTIENEFRIDSLITLLKDYKPGNKTSELYYLARTLFGKIARLQYNKRTYDQMKSSGSLRLIHNESLLDSISIYFESLQWIDLQNVLQLERQTQYGLGLGEIFDAWTIDSVFNNDYEIPVSAPPLLTTEKKELNKFVIRLHILKGVVIFVVNRVKDDYLPNAKNLISLIKKEYHLE